MQRLIILLLTLLSALHAGNALAFSDVDIADSVRNRIGDHRLIVLGEMHGTREVPRLVKDLATAFGAEAPVLVALELSRSEQGAVDAYLRSDGSEVDRRALLASGYWYRPSCCSDGRRNRAVIDLLEAMRVMRRHGHDVAVLMFDIAASHADAAVRDRAMAAHIRRAFEALPRGRMLVVAGNVHAMLIKPDYCPQCQAPMTGHLRDLDPYSIDIQALSGSFVACRTPDTCGPMPVPKRTDRAAGIEEAATDAPFHAYLRLPHFTPALPVSKAGGTH